ncbi:Response regulator receiver protein (modular protein) [Verrucomicrobia bacterium]|nr:Response regulator receiver protein (modular protein) [Verrucomicrobiota bacterium]
MKANGKPSNENPHYHRTYGFKCRRHKTVKTILQVENDPNDAFLLQHAMRRARIANPIQVVTDGQQAIDYLQGAGKFADRVKFPFPCLVLLDLNLAYVRGLDVLRWIRQQPGMALAVIMLTACGSEADIAEAYRLGASAFLTKPSEASKLEEMVEAIRDFWLTYNTLPQESSSESGLELVVRHVPSFTACFAGRPGSRMNGVSRAKRPRPAKGRL